MSGTPLPTEDLKFQVSGSNRPLIREALRTHVCLSGARQARRVLLAALAASGAGLWIGARWPDSVHGTVATMFLRGWAALFCLTLGAAGHEWYWHRRRARCLARMEADSGTRT